MIYRGKVDNIVFEFSLPKKIENNKGVIVICDGLPSVPKRKKIINYLTENGFSVIYPRYEGTWESGGTFLSHAPTDDIKTVIEFTQNNAVRELYDGKKFNLSFKRGLYIIGSSFGGSVALSLSDKESINKIVALSPVVNFKNHNKKGNEQDLSSLGMFIQKGFGHGYRFNEGDWNNMVEGNLFNPPQKIKGKKAKRILILYGKKDETVSPVGIESYCKKNNIKTMVLKNAGHLSFSKTPLETWDNIIEWLNKK